MNNLSNIEDLLLAFDKTRSHSLAYLLLSLVASIGVFAILVIGQLKSLFDLNSSIIMILVIPIIVIGFFIYRTYKKMNTEEQKILNSIIRERYYENYLSAIPEGNTPIEKFVSISEEIFPQIKMARKDSKNSLQKEKKIEIKYKTQKYIIEQFSDSFSINDLKKIIRVSKQDSISRYIILGKDLTNSIQDKSFEIIMKDVTKVDLITIHNNDFKIEWIS